MGSVKAPCLLLDLEWSNMDTFRLELIHLNKAPKIEYPEVSVLRLHSVSVLKMIWFLSFSINSMRQSLYLRLFVCLMYPTLISIACHQRAWYNLYHLSLSLSRYPLICIYIKERWSPNTGAYEKKSQHNIFSVV